MRGVLEAFPDDLEVRSVFVEAIMNETPWKMWDLKTGDVAEKAGTVEARKVLEGAFKTIPESWDHPGLLHLYVHLMEMSPFPSWPEPATGSARSCRTAGIPTANPHRRAVRPTGRGRL